MLDVRSVKAILLVAGPLDFTRKAEIARSVNMLLRAYLAAALVCGGAIMVGTTTPAAAEACKALAFADPDNDGTLDLKEAEKAATSVFERLDVDKKKTLDKRKLKDRLSAEELTAADPDKDGTLDLAEYLRLVEKRFNAANPDKDGTIDCKEIDTKEGKALLKLLH